jgi:hypothetical protein
VTVRKTTPTIEAARKMGEVGAEEFGVPHDDAERLAFESWMAGHCWSLAGVTWDGSGYRGEGETLGRVSLAAMDVRRLWAAWRDRAAFAPQPLPPVEGDILPAVGSKVLIHLASQDAWVEHTVVGYYVWPNHGLAPRVFRVFVRVRDTDGYLNARSLEDIRYLEAATQAPAAA